jgi:hypothetical protein
MCSAFQPGSNSAMRVSLAAVRHMEAAAILIALLCTACSVMPNGGTIDYAAAREVSDSFMADLVADRLNDAVNLMEPDFVNTVGHAQAEVQIKKPSLIVVVRSIASSNTTRLASRFI